MAIQLNTTLQMLGLVTQPNNISVSPGTMSICNNFLISRDNILQRLPGVFPWSTVLPVEMGGDGLNKILSLYEFDGVKLVRTSDGILYSFVPPNTWTKLGDGLVNSDNAYTEIFSVQANSNIYFVGGNFGTKKLDDPAGPVRLAGIPQGLDGQAVLSIAGAGWFTTHTNVAYRVVWGRLGNDQQLYLGAPGDRIDVSNTTSTNDTTALTFTIPSEIDTNYIYRIYRSALSADLATPPSDDMYQVFEGHPTSGQIAAKLVTFTDDTPDAIRATGTPLYTNSGFGGIIYSNDRPPSAKCIGLFRNRLFWGNTTSKQQYKLTIVSVGSPNGIQNGDTLTFTTAGGPTFTLTGSTSAENTATGTFKVSTGGTVSENLTDTASSLIRVINRWASSASICANNLSGPTDTPGKILITARDFGTLEFALTSNRSTCWFPTLPSSGTTQSSQNVHNKNFLRFSKNGEVEAVPQSGTNFIPVGSANHELLQIIPLNQSLIIWKEDGLFRLTGTTEADFLVSTADPTLFLLAPKTAKLLNNTAIGYTNQGIIQVFDGGSTPLISRPIENLIQPLPSLENFADAAWGISYETERQYRLFVPTESHSDPRIDTVYIYNYIAKGQPWTSATYNLAGRAIPYCGLVSQVPTDGKLYYGCSAAVQDLGNPPNKFIYQERKTASVADYINEEWTATLDTAAGKTLSVASSTYGIERDMVVVQGELSSKVKTVTNATTFVVEDTLAWVEGEEITIQNPIYSRVVFNSFNCGTPPIVKQFIECLGIFREADFVSLSFDFTTDLGSEVIETFNPVILGAYGIAFPYGTGNYGGGGSTAQVIKRYVPQESAWGHWLTVGLEHSEVRSNFLLEGITLTYLPSSTDFIQEV